MELIDKINSVMAELDRYYRITGDPIYYDAYQMIKCLMEIAEITIKGVDR